MPRNVSGTYTLPLPPVVPNTVIDSSWANDTMDDIAAALTESLSRTGDGGMTAPFRVVDGTETSPGFAFVAEPGSGLFRETTGVVGMSILGDGKQYWNAGGSNIAGDLGVFGNIGATGNVTIDGEATVIGDLNTLGGLNVLGPLEVAGTITVGGNIEGVSTAFAYTISAEPSGPGLGGAMQLWGSASGTPSIVNFWTGGDERLRIAADGSAIFNVGVIGLAITPALSGNHGMHIHSHGGIGRLRMTNTATGIADGAGFQILVDTSGVPYFHNGGALPMVFYTTALERMRIAASGNVAIGNPGADPPHRLTVTGNAIQVGDAFFTGWIGKGSALITGGTATEVAIRSDGDLVFAYSSEERMRITAPSGNVRIGTAALGAVSGPFEVVKPYTLFRDGTYTGYLGQGTLASGGALSAFALRSELNLYLVVAGGLKAMEISTAGVITDRYGLELGWKDLPQNYKAVAYALTATDRGTSIVFNAAGDAYIDPLAVPGGAVMTIVNHRATSMNIIQNPGMTVRWGGTTASGNRVLGPYGIATVYYINTGDAIISGAGLS